jgi:hypothetical protein
MLVGYTFEPSSFELGHLHPRQKSIRVKNSLNKLLRHGLLVRPASDDAWGEFKKSLLKALPEKRKEVHEFLKRIFKLKAGNSEWRGITKDSSEEELNFLRESVAVLGCSPELAVVTFGCPDPGEKGSTDVATMHESGIQIALTEELVEVPAFDAASALAEQGIGKGELLKDVLTSRFGILAANSKNIRIIDSYCVHGGITGLKRFLHYVDQATDISTRVEIYACCDTGRFTKGGNWTVTDSSTNPNLVFDTFGIWAHEVRSAGGIKSVTLKLVPHQYFKDDAHDRFISFDHLYVHLGSGVELFDGNRGKTKKTCEFKLKPIDSFYANEVHRPLYDNCPDRNSQTA